MGETHLAGPVKLVIGILAKDREWLSRARAELARVFGRSDLESPVIPFGFTDYYLAEMGEGLLRQWVGLESLVMPDGLAGIKLATNRMEQEWAQDGKRPVNLDPGYVNDSRLILATTKDFSHRIYLGSGIYAETTLIYKGEAFRALDWTYPDYQSETATEFLNQARALYMARIESYPDVKGRLTQT
jgi:hypothetical protein